VLQIQLLALAPLICHGWDGCGRPLSHSSQLLLCVKCHPCCSARRAMVRLKNGHKYTVPEVQKHFETKIDELKQSRMLLYTVPLPRVMSQVVSLGLWRAFLSRTPSHVCTTFFLSSQCCHFDLINTQLPAIRVACDAPSFPPPLEKRLDCNQAWGSGLLPPPPPCANPPRV
jgi:hypothetical protein